MTYLLGKDVSHYQAPADWSPAPLGFLIARATIGTQPDALYARHIAQARRAGLVTGAYHFNHGPIAVAAQVGAFLEAAGDVDGLALDVEGADAFTGAQAAEFIDRVQQTGRRIGLYHSRSGYPASAWGADWRWVADWGQTAPPIPWDVWQFGPMDGEDGNRYRGSADELRALWRGTMNPLRITSPAPKIVALTVGDQLFNPDGSKLVVQSVVNSLPSPYEATIGAVRYRVLTVLVNGLATMALVKVADVVLSDPPADPTPYSQADLDKAIADTKAAATVAVVFP